MIEFYKYQGTGNDFILIDNRQSILKTDKIKFAQKWCDRRFGIGSDGMIFIENSNDVDFIMDFYNPDGSQSFCGNGSRCAVRFAQSLNLISNSITKFLAIDGVHIAELVGEKIRIKMNDVKSFEMIGEDYFINTGSPHYISYENESPRDIINFGKSIRYNNRFKSEGTNVNLIREKCETHIAIRTYERGVEDETFSCGTGATACALSSALKNQLDTSKIQVDVKGGTLYVDFKKIGDSFTDIWLEGPAEFVYKGIIHDTTN